MHPPLRAILLLSTLALIACGETTSEQTADSSSSEGSAAAAEEGSADVPAVEDPVDLSIEELRSRLAADFPGVYREYLREYATQDALEAILFVEEPPVRIRRQRFLAEMYDARDYVPVFAQPRGLHDRALGVLEILSGAAVHAFDVESFYDQTLIDAVEAFQEVHYVRTHAPIPEPETDELLALIQLLDSEEIRNADEPLSALMEFAFETEEGPLSTWSDLHEERVEVERAYAGATALAEALLADRVMHYAFEMRHFNVAWVDEELDDDAQHEVIHAQMTGTFEALADAADASAAEGVLESLQPSHAQYGLLLAERARYLQIVENGGWEEIRPIHLERGHNHPRVEELKQRLAIEGYYEGEIDQTFDADLEASVSHYQRTHQMEVTGESSRVFWNSINIPAEQRLAQIELTLQRWRESRVGDDTYYVHVNVPDFHAEVWRDGERQMRFKVVVGNTDRVCDRSTGQWRYANATPLQSAQMSYVVLNPYWNVPRRILEEELLPAQLEDETYFEEHGIERITNEHGVEIIRQAPGPDNPLGQVKFMFPNPHNTYMHDTSRPNYFQYPIRAFSHGCMRVETPQELLRLVLENDGQWDERQIERVFERGEETGISLNDPIPVHIEYYVVRADDDGYANFLADIYRYDRDRMDPPSARDLSCTPDEAPPLRLVLGEEMELLYEDQEGNIIEPDSEEYEAIMGPAEGEEGEDPMTDGDFGP